MPRCHTFIEAKPEDVFAYVADLPRHKEWAADTVNPVPLTAEPVAVGKRYLSTNQFMGREVRDKLEISIYDPPRRFGFNATGPNGDSFEHEFSCRPQDGGTLVERNITVRQMALPLKLIFPVAYLLLGRPRDAKSMQQLKQRLEQMAASR